MVEVPIGARQLVGGIVEDFWQAKPGTELPFPVILVHGTISSKQIWSGLVPRLRERGFVVFCPDYGNRGTGPIPDSAEQLDAYIRQVVHATGAEKVDVVGHSQGGLLTRYWMHHFGGAALVNHVVTLGATHHGTTMLGMVGNLLTGDTANRVLQAKATSAAVRRFFGEAGNQQIIGSPILEDMESRADTVEGVRYSCFATRQDVTVRPLEHAFLIGQPSGTDPLEVEGAARPVVQSPEQAARAFGDEDDSTELLRNFFVQDFGVTRVMHDHLPSHAEVQSVVLRALEWGQAHPAAG